ncbi:hypothetical protein L1987_50191 [Smallanthus sonchifolius]|uniref:Uncharacterized protein n=1 Tax=Smallanthus sonchifolius TaxID=185202 RepID=A0ACB9FXD5_9ASTR|nr:hypothetical protein L1987_50191 [Smallanthus sonchifolius]
MGFGRKIDPEPGRCRRTDGKKWRCSKEAYPESKYCERHMHRGRNRSRKPVELNMSTPIPSSDYSNNISGPSSKSQHHLLLDSSPYRKSYGIKEEHPFFSESSGTIKTSMGEYHQNGYSYQQQQEDCYDELALKIDRKDGPQKVMHQFFDEWPPNNKNSSTT